MNVRYRVELSESERLELQGMLSGGEGAVRRLKRAQILLASDLGQSEEGISRTLGVGISTVYRTRRRFVEGNLEGALSEEPRPGKDGSGLTSLERRGLPAEGLLGAVAPRPFGVALKGDQRRCATLSNPACYVSGVRMECVWQRRATTVYGIFWKICRLRDSNPRPTVYKTVALPLC